MNLTKLTYFISWLVLNTTIQCIRKINRHILENANIHIFFLIYPIVVFKTNQLINGTFQLNS